LFDLWIDAAEEAYAEIALSPEFRAAYGARVNAQMRLRQAVQGEIERTSALFGMPTRSDLDSAFRKIADLERALRAVRDQVQPASPRGAKSQAAGPKAAGKSTSVKAAPTAAAAKRAPARGTPAMGAASKSTPAGTASPAGSTSAKAAARKGAQAKGGKR
jgi:hypothetical protein